MSDTGEHTGPEAERIIASLRPHGRALFWPSVILIAASGATAYFDGHFARAWQNWAVLGAGGVIVLLFWVLPLLAWLSKRYVITTRRIVLRRGLFVRTRQELLHSRGYDVTVRKNAVQSVFRCGDVSINVGLDHPVVLRDIPNANLVQSCLHDLMERALNPIAARRQAEQAGSASDQTTGWGIR
jgi:uncharacterized membrane protein YdbT with pleckstrin-like domain